MSNEVDYEGELALVIGKPAKNVPASEAFEYLAGYTVANDLTARDLQRNGAGGQWVRGKTWTAFALWDLVFACRRICPVCFPEDSHLCERCAQAG